MPLLHAPPQRNTLGVKRCATCQERHERRLSASSKGSRGKNKDKGKGRARDARASTSSTSSGTSGTSGTRSSTNSRDSLLSPRTSEDTDTTAVGSDAELGRKAAQPVVAESRWRRAASIVVHDIPAFIGALIVVMTCGGVNPKVLTL